MTRVTKTTMSHEEVDEAARACVVGGMSGYNGPELLHLTITLCVVRSFTEQPEGSNSTEQLLSDVHRRTEIRFLISLEETRTLLRDKCPGRDATPVAVIGSKQPSPTTIDEGKGYRGDKMCERVEGFEVMWEVAPESKYQSV